MNSATLAAILLMAAATYAMRAGGYWAMGRVPIRGFTEAWLRALPGPVLIALIAPGLVAGGAAEWAGAGATLATLKLSGREDLAVLVGIAAVAAARGVGLR